MSVLPIVVSILASTAISPAEPVHVTGLQGLGNTQHHVIESESLGRSYDVLVGLPDGYDETDDTSYPTVYILDGGNLYPLLRVYHQYLRYGGEAPEMILVAMSYGTNDYENGNDRGHDYPTYCIWTVTGWSVRSVLRTNSTHSFLGPYREQPGITP